MELTLRKSLNKAYLKVKPNRDEIEKFKINLITMCDKINEQESEEFHKGLLSHFIRETYYGNDYFINTKGRNDLVIHNGRNSSNHVGVIIETKRPACKTEMPKPGNLNAKAVQELLLYYLRERITVNNLDLKHLIVTDVYEWFIFDAAIFEKTFAKSHSLIKQFKDFEAKNLPGLTTSFFYKEIAAPAIAAVQEEIDFTYFDLRDYYTPLRNSDQKDDHKLVVLYKIFTPEHLLKLPFANDSNTLDKSFYAELLHLIGLAETKDGGKKIIGRKPENDRSPASIIENTIVQLDSLDKLSQITKAERFGDTRQTQLFNIALELAITWVNRILFLKLLEAQLLKYHKGSNDLAFLNLEKVHNYDDLNRLFFQVLAKPQQERISTINSVFANVPYLNSSLFEPTELEQRGVFISQLDNELQLPILAATVLKDHNGKKRSGKLETLAYFFEFLNAYDFSSEGSEDIQEDNKTLINASVLGLIFEKINGYKDGSFFTPGFITMYMCHESIRRAVLQKFRDVKGWNCDSVEQLHDMIGENKAKAEANQIINSLKICDPAVGSGHFLVSALNEIIALKSELGILLDRQGKAIHYYTMEVVNDELIVTDDNSELFEYRPGNPEAQRIQETLFHEKQTLIENCLFGVDINPNSVKICRLRLWIELLKNAYYKTDSNYTELETLPNIDINIKCGNSLISRYDLNADIKKALRKSKWTIDGYRLAVSAYRNARSKDEKRKMEGLIDTIKKDFESEINHTDKRVARLEKMAHELLTLDPRYDLFDLPASEKKKQAKERQRLIANIQKLEAEIEAIKSNKIYENAFEWRFEFPEVLNDDGRFIGFDLVIGNPPYISLEAFSAQEREALRSKFPQFERKFETSVLFMVEGFKLLHNAGILSYIAPATWQTGENYAKFRQFVVSEKGIKEVINLPFDTFEDAYVDTSLYLFYNQNTNSYRVYSFNKKHKTVELNNLAFDEIEISRVKPPDYKIIIDVEVEQLMRKYCSEKYIQLGEITKSTQGLSGSNFIKSDSINSDDNYPFLLKGNVYNYTLVKNDIYITNLKGRETLKSYYDAEPKLLIRRIINRQDRLSVGYCDEKLVFKKDINPFILTDPRIDIKFLIAIMASKFISYLYVRVSSIALKDDFRQTTLSELRRIPIPLASPTTQQPFILLVDQILSAKKLDPTADTSGLEQEIDRMVYALYGLTEEEIRSVEGQN